MVDVNPTYNILRTPTPLMHRSRRRQDMCIMALLGNCMEWERLRVHSAWKRRGEWSDWEEVGVGGSVLLLIGRFTATLQATPGTPLPINIQEALNGRKESTHMQKLHIAAGLFHIGRRHCNPITGRCAWSALRFSRYWLTNGLVMTITEGQMLCTGRVRPALHIARALWYPYIRKHDFTSLIVVKISFRKGTQDQKC